MNQPPSDLLRLTAGACVILNAASNSSGSRLSTSHVISVFRRSTSGNYVAKKQLVDFGGCTGKMHDFVMTSDATVTRSFVSSSIAFLVLQ